MLSWFAFFRDPADPARRLPPALVGTLSDRLRRVPGLTEALVFTPVDVPDRSPVAHPFPDDEPAPALALQLRFPAVEPMEAALRADGPLDLLTGPSALPGLAGMGAVQQAMVTRAFPVPDPRPVPGVDGTLCSYLVHYPGAAEDLPAWLAYYIDHHPALMARFPGVRQIEIFTRLDWCAGVRLPRVEYMQRNKLVFDTPAALSAGLLSPAIRDMRADYHRFPPFTGGNVHYPMTTRSFKP